MYSGTIDVIRVYEYYVVAEGVRYATFPNAPTMCDLAAPNVLNTRRHSSSQRSPKLRVPQLELVKPEQPNIHHDAKTLGEVDRLPLTDGQDKGALLRGHSRAGVACRAAEPAEPRA